MRNLLFVFVALFLLVSGQDRSTVNNGGTPETRATQNAETRATNNNGGATTRAQETRAETRGETRPPVACPNGCPTGSQCVDTNTNPHCSTPVNPCGNNFPYGCPSGYQCVTTNEGNNCRIVTTPPTQCDANRPCTDANRVCVEGTCRCRTGFGGSTCTAIGCQDNVQCAANAYCVVATNGAPAYCHCKPGFTGAECRDVVTATCNPQSCAGKVHAACNNEGRCVCAAGFSGDDCNTDQTTTACDITITITCTPPANGPLTADQVRTRLASLIRIDISNIVITGPTSVANNRVQYSFSLCSTTSDVNTNLASSAFFNAINGGNDGGIGIVGTTSATTPQAGTSAVLVSSFAATAYLAYSLM